MKRSPKVDLSPDPGWTEVASFGRKGSRRSFVSGDPRGSRIRVRYYRREADRALVGKVWLGPGAEGPPGYAHGGSIAAVLDSAMGRGAWMAGYAVVAARITVHYLRMVPLETVMRVEAQVHRVEGRKVHMKASLLGPGGRVHSRSEGLFVELDAHRLEQLEQKLPGARKKLRSLRAAEED